MYIYLTDFIDKTITSLKFFQWINRYCTLDIEIFVHMKKDCWFFLCNSKKDLVLKEQKDVSL